MDTETIDNLIIQAIKNNKEEKKKPYTEPKQSSIKIYREQLKKLYQSVNGNQDITMEGLAKIIVNFDMVKNYLDKPENDFSNATKKNYVNNALNIVMYITDINNYYNVKPIKINKIREAITTYWEQLIEKVNKQYLENNFPLFKNGTFVIHTNKEGRVEEGSSSKSQKELSFLREIANKVDRDDNDIKVIISVLMLSGILEYKTPISNVPSGLLLFNRVATSIIDEKDKTLPTCGKLSK